MKIQSTLLFGAGLLALLILNACKDDEQPPVELLINGSADAGESFPDSWFLNNPQNEFALEWTDEQAYSPSRSLKISSPVERTDFAYWAQRIATNIPVGQDVTLRAKIKGNLEGTGVAIVIRADDTAEPDGNADQFATTAGDRIGGNIQDWKDYSVTLFKVEENIKSLTVYLIYLPTTTGEVYFDDISLTF